MALHIDRTTRETHGYLGNVHNQTAELLFVPGMTPPARLVNHTITFQTKQQLQVDEYSAPYDPEPKRNSNHYLPSTTKNTADNISHLCNVDRIYYDQTFYTAPPMFDSILTTHAFVGSLMFRLVVTLLSKRDKHTYARLFRLLKEISSATTKSSHQLQLALTSSVLHAMRQN